MSTSVIFPAASGCSNHLLGDRTEQLVARKRFGQILFRPYDPAARPIKQAVLAGQHDHRGITETRIVLDQRTGLITIQPWHHDVDKDDGW